MLMPVTSWRPKAVGVALIRAAVGGLGLVLVLGAGPAWSETLHQTYRFEPSRLERAKAGAYETLRAPDLPQTWEAGQPEIPFDLVTVLVPQGSRLVGLRARALGEHVVAQDVLLQTAAPIENDLGQLLDPRPPRLTAEASKSGAVDPLRVPAPDPTAYPAILAEPAGGGALHGYQLISVRVFPVRYEAETRRVVAAERIDLELDLAPGGALPLGRARYRPEIEAAARRTLESWVANPTALDTYARRIGVRVESPEGGFQPSDAPSLEGSVVDYVIVTTDALASAYQVLADWKTLRGVPTVVRTVEWIQANYRHGSDIQETIRTFIQDAYAKWGVQYVALAGDTDILPARYGYSAFGEPTERHIPSDLYFACLDGNWNMDGDALWGEAAISISDPGDSTDLYAEVHVGRIPFSTSAKAAAYIGKLIGYENAAQTTYQNKVLMLAEVLFPVDWDSGMTISMDGAQFSEEMLSYASGCISPTRLYENYIGWPGSQPLTLAAAISAMNAGQGLVNHIGHGFRYNMSCGDLSFQNHNALALTNTDKRFVLYMLNCTATAFDFPCLAEAFLESSGGAVGVLGASRAAYALPSRNYNRGFFQALYQQGYTHLGELFTQSRLAQTPNAWFDTADHYSHLLYNFLGDPEMVMHSCTLGATTASYPGSLSPGTTNVTVHVNVGGVPRQNALVCLQKGTEEYEAGLTDALGDVTLPVRVETSGTLQVTVSGQNMTTHLGSISVGSGTLAYVRTTTLTVDDNGTGASNGNSDGVLDAGETLELAVGFQNSGTQPTGAVAGVLRIPGGAATVVDSTYSFASLNPGGGTTSTNQVYFTVPAGTADGTVLPLTFVSTGSGTWTDVVNKVVHAPRMELTLLDVDDFAPGGNGDGVIQANEIFDLIVYWKNYGTGAADGLTGTLSSGDADVTIFNGAVSVGRADPLEEVTGATRFRLRETVLDENGLVLTLTDNRGRSLVSSITLRGPAQPVVPTLDASTGANIVIVSWTPSVDPDLAGYHVYRALSASGPWTRATIDRTAGVAYLRDSGLAPSTLYYYRVTAVDGSGNESPYSTSVSINTNPAQLNGWPINLAGSSSCPVAVGDITGDGSKEIVAGNTHLYGWNNNGIELLDDDGDPQTWGVFSIEIQTVTGAIALAELDTSSPGFEAFVTSWDDTMRTFVVRGDGSFAPGWPRNPDPNSGTKGYWAGSTAVDIDGDGLAECFAPAKNGHLYAWHADGTPLGALPAFKTSLGTWSRSQPSIANIDGDPDKEIIYGSPTGVLHIWNADGSVVAPFPKTAGTLCLSNTAVGDVNNDGTLDVVMITEGGKVHVYNTRTGNELSGWPKNVNVSSNPKTPSPALADFDFDGFLEIVVALNYSGAGTVTVYNHLGVVQSGWPKNLANTSESSPIVADFSGDGQPDVLFGNEGGLLYGWDRFGNNIAGFPLTVGDFIRSTPFADDVDGDGGIDLVLSGWDKNVYIWDFPAPYVAAAAQWPTASHDSQRSAYYNHHPQQPTDTGDPVVSAPPQRAFLAQNSPNPFNPVTSIQYGVPADAGKLPVRVDIFDVQGRLVRRLVHGDQGPGTYRAMWDGRSDRGVRVQSGVYFYRLKVGAEILTRKMLLLK